MKDDPFNFIDSLPWSEVAHAYGVATEAPSQLRCLISADVEEREEAVIDFLYSSVFHQYSLYSATPFVMQSVLKLLEWQDMPQQAGSTCVGSIAYELLHFIRMCAECGQRSVEGVLHPAAPIIEDVARSGLDTYRRYATHEEANVRAEANALLTWVESGEAVFPPAKKLPRVIPLTQRHPFLEFPLAIWPALVAMIVTPLSICFRQPWIGIVILMGLVLAYKRWWTCVFGLLNFMALSVGVLSCSIAAIKLLTR
jgi:hypothetical protein